MPHRIKRLAAVLAAAFTLAGLGSVAAASAGTASAGTASAGTASAGTASAGTASAGTAPARPASPATSASVPSSTLINFPATQVCRYHRFTVGVWAQPGTSWANRRYVVNVYNPDWVQVLHESGHAPTSSWLFWHPTAGKLGRYHTIYQNWQNGVRYRTRYVTRSVRC